MSPENPSQKGCIRTSGKRGTHPWDCPPVQHSSKNGGAGTCMELSSTEHRCDWDDILTGMTWFWGSLFVIVCHCFRLGKLWEPPPHLALGPNGHMSGTGDSHHNASVWGSHADFQGCVPSWLYVPSSKHFLVHKAPSLSVYFLLLILLLLCVSDSIPL